MISLTDFKETKISNINYVKGGIGTPTEGGELCRPNGDCLEYGSDTEFNVFGYISTAYHDSCINGKQC